MNDGLRATPADLEPVTERAWVAQRRERLGQWRLNASAGHSGRLNACWPLGDSGRPLDEAIVLAEAWMRARGLPPMFKFGEGAPWPASLAERLSARGYRAHTETLVMVGPVVGAPSARVTLSDELEPDFLEVFGAAVADPGDRSEREAALARTPAPRRLAVARLDGAPAAVGACAVEGPWVGVFAMRTLPHARRLGLAREILGALMAFAAGAGASRAWLQVEAQNAGAIALYRSVGFDEAYRYRYWTAP